MNIDSMLTVPVSELTSKEWRRVLERLTFTVDDTEVFCYQWLATKQGYRIPRGARDFFSDVPVRDLRSRPRMAELDFVRTLDAEGHEGQEEAVAAMLKHEQGQIIRMPGSGKTNIALAFIAACKTRTLVLTHTVDIMAQWREYAEKSIPGIKIGTIQGQTCEIGHLTLATPQTLRRYVNDGRKFWGQFGCLIADEQHHSAAMTWEWIMNVCPAYYRFGLSATERRADEMHPLIRFLIGPVIHRQVFKARVPTKVVPVKSGLRMDYRGPADYKRLQNKIVEHHGRNKIIAQIADREVNDGHSVLVLSRRVEHLVRIREMMATDHNAVLIGSRPQDDYSKDRVRKPTTKERKQMVEDFRSGKIRCLLATQLADEALDIPRLDRIILTYPGKHDGRIIQQVGRGTRKFEGKTDCVIFDIVDSIPVLERQYALRKRAYRSMKIEVAQGIVHTVKKLLRGGSR